MRVISYNINGIRSAIRKGFLEWLAAHPADIVCLQEVKATEDDIDFSAFNQLGYDVFLYAAEKKGYSGVAVLTKEKPDWVQYGSGMMQSDAEGRVMLLQFGSLTVVNAYFPSGSSGEHRQAYKFQWLEEFYAFICRTKKEHPNLIVCGDYNICHRPIDIHNPVSTKKSSGFLPEERAWMDKWFQGGFVDSFRHFNNDPHHYSWWSFRANARANNKGWRIDYICVSESLKPALRAAAIYPDIVHSDHCPVYMEIDTGAVGALDGLQTSD